MLNILLFTAVSNAALFSGRIFDFKSKNPVEGADIYEQKSGNRTLSDENGYFEIEVSDEEIFVISISRRGYSSVKKQIETGHDQKEIQSFYLVPVPVFSEEIIVLDSFDETYPFSVYSGSDMYSRKSSDVGEMLGRIPGGNAVRRGGTALDPVFRGFQKEQLNVLLNGIIRFEGACPNRMDHSASHISATDLERLEIFKGPFSFTLGPVFGGVINMVEKSGYMQLESPGFSGTVLSKYGTNKENLNNSLSLSAGTERINMSVSASIQSSDDYRDGSGIIVPSSYNRRGITFKSDFMPLDDHFFDFSFAHGYWKEADYAALPMDMEFDRTNLYSLGYEWKPGQTILNSIGAGFYLSKVYHSMNNENKPSAVNMNAVTDVESSACGSRIQGDVNVAGGVLFVGADFYRKEKEGFRKRDILKGMMAGKSFIDIVWPDARQSNTGLFAEYEKAFSQSLVMMFSGRLDYNSSDASNPEESFTAIYGRDLDRSEKEYSAAANVSHQISDKLRLKYSIGRGSRSPDTTELYIYLLPVGVDRYDYIGNPRLDAEVNNQIEFDMNYESRYFRLKTSLYYALLRDYISAEIDEKTASRSPGVLGVKKFINIPRAYRTGAEASIDLKITEGFELYLNGSYCYGRNRSDDDYLPETPPLEGNFGFSYRRNVFHLSGNIRAVDRQDKISSLFNETETAGFTLYSLSAGADFDMGTISVEVDNISDKLYSEHLSRKYLSTDQRIFEPGRCFTVSFRKVF